MASPVVGLCEVETVEHVLHVLRDTTHHGFPVYARDSAGSRGRDAPDGAVGGRLEGTILRSQLVVLLEAGAFCDAEGRYLQGRDAAQYEAMLAEAMRAVVAQRRCATCRAWLSWHTRAYAHFPSTDN